MANGFDVATDRNGEINVLSRDGKVIRYATDGSLLDVLTMEPCGSGPCPRYGVDELSQWVIEVPAGRFNALPTDARLDVGRDPFLPLIEES